MIKKLFAIIEKDVRQLVHSKSSALIILISPIVLMILAGMALSSSGLSGVKIGVYADKSLLESAGTSTILPVLDAKMAEKGFAVQYFSSIDTCKQAVKDETTHICVEVAEKEDKNLAKVDARLMYRVNFYVDYSKVRLVWAIVNAIRTIVAEENAKITAEMAAKISTKMEWTINEITRKQGTIDQLVREGETLRNRVSDVEEKARDLGSYLNQIDSLIMDFNGMTDSMRIAADGIEFSVDNLKKMPVVANAGVQATSNLNLIIERANTIIEISNSIDSATTRLGGIVSTLRNKQIEMQSSMSSAAWQVDLLLSEMRNVRTSINDVVKELSWAQNIKAHDITNPIPVEVLPLSGEVTEVGSVQSALTYLDYLLPALVILVIMFVSTLIASTIVIKERKSDAYFRNIIAPASTSLYVFGVFLIGLIMVAMQAALLVLVASVFFGVSISSYASIAIVLALTISIFILLGIIIGYLFNSEETTMMGAISLALVCLLFSALIIPLETMPTLMRAIAQFSPFVIAETALRKIMIFNIPIINYATRKIMWEPVKLVAITIMLFIVALVIQKFKNRKEI